MFFFLGALGFWSTLVLSGFCLVRNCEFGFRGIFLGLDLVVCVVPGLIQATSCVGKVLVKRDFDEFS